MSDNLKKLTGKNPKDFEPTAKNLINNADEELFCELVEKEDFLFDFIKQNVASRLEKACNRNNYKNLIKFLKYYSPSYEDFIVSTLAKYADEDLTDIMLDIFENGTVDEKTYCAKFFSYIQDPLAIDFLNANAYSQDGSLSANCAQALALFGDKNSYNSAIEKLDSADDFECLDAVRFLVNYGDRQCFDKIIDRMKTSSMSENIAAELPYLIGLDEIISNNKTNGLYVLNNIINGLGEIISLSQIFDFQMYEILEKLISTKSNSECAVILLNAKDKFDALTENDEYLYDEQKDVKQEVYAIKDLLSELDAKELEKSASNEIRQESLFVFSALEFTSDEQKVRSLLSSENQTLVLKSIEVLKKLNKLNMQDKEIALSNVSNLDIKSIIEAL